MAGSGRRRWWFLVAGDSDRRYLVIARKEVVVGCGRVMEGTGNGRVGDGCRVWQGNGRVGC